MGVLRDQATGDITILPARLLIGRSSLCTLRVDHGHASSEHASIAWTGSAWEIRDLGSKNGTFRNATRLEAGVTVKLKAGDALSFGRSEVSHVITDVGAPGLSALCVETKEVRISETNLLALPDEDAVEASAFLDAQEQWMLEPADGSEPQPLEDRALVRAGGRTWRIQLPIASEGTPMAQIDLSIDSAKFVFRVSQDEEHTELSVVGDHRRVDLEAREYWYLLLLLARARDEDAEASPDARGWRDRDELADMLRVDVNSVNVSIHRARNQLVKAGVRGAAGIVEVRKRLRRLGTERYSIERL